MARWWQALAILIGGPVLGLAIGGLPDFSREPQVVTATSPDTGPTTTTAPGEAPAAPPATTAEPPPPRPPAQVKVRVYLASTVSGAGTNAVNKLRPAGYVLLEPAWAPKDQPATTRVYFDPGFDREARAVAAALGVSATVAPLPPGIQIELTEEPDIVVLAGNDLAPR